VTRLAHLVTTLARIVVATMLGVSAYWKIIRPGAFLEAVVEYQLVPFSLALVVASWLPWLELVVALALTTRWYRGAAMIALVLGVTFVLAQSSVLVRGLSVPCGCFGPTDERVGALSLIRSMLFLVGAWLAFRSRDWWAVADRTR
jgi:hypothetical protein